jgi:hypothetical protein
MDELVRTLTFFRVVPPVPRLMVGALIVVTALAMGSVVWKAGGAPAGAVPILVLQAFACSTGFVVSGRRGHYDVLLTGGAGRIRTAIVHWCLSAAPGAACVGALAAVQQLEGGGSTGTAASGTLTALWIVSTLPWASTVGLPRFSGAIGWATLLAMIGALPSRDRLVFDDAGATGIVRGSLELLVFPFGLAGAAVGQRAPLALGAALISGAAVAAALCWVRRVDLPLQEGQ